MDNPGVNFFVLAGSIERIEDAITYGGWNGEVSNNRQLAKIQKGDILLFYSLQPINGLVGFATVKNKIGGNNFCSKIAFERDYCLPLLFWKEQKIDFDNFDPVVGINWLGDNEEITRLSTLMYLRWGTELKSRIESEVLESPLFYKNKCIKCGREIDSRIAKYCVECRIKVRKRQILEWNRKNIDKIRKAGRKWREDHPDKVREYSRRWKEAHPDKLKEIRKRWKEKKGKISLLEKHKKSLPYMQKEMSDWCKGLRKDPAHLSWMGSQKKRREKIAEIESKFNCYWEDKFKEVYENYKQEDTAKRLNLNYRTVFVWAKHLKLKRLCTYCGKKLVGSEGKFHSKCREKFELSQRKQKYFGIKKLFKLINPMINAEIIDFSENNIIDLLNNVLTGLFDREAFILKNRYLDCDFEDRKTLAEIGSILGITRERVRQLESQAIKKLSHPSRLKLVNEKLINIIFKGEQSSKIKEKVGMAEKQQISNTPLSEIEMSVRALNCLRGAGIRTLGELANKTESEMLSIRNLGKKTMGELRRILDSFGLKFKKETFFNLHYKRIPLQFKKYGGNEKEGKEKCFFPECEVTPHRGRYCSKHKTAWQRKRALQLKKVD